jgi:hypothetical protein
MIEKSNEKIEEYQPPDQVILEQDKDYNKSVASHTANMMKKKGGDDPYNKNKELSISHQLRFGVMPKVYES